MLRRILLTGMQALLLVFMACSRQAPPIKMSAAPAVPSGRACLAALGELGIPIEPWFPDDRSCPVDAPVLAPGPVPRLSPPLRTSCSLLYVWVKFEPEIDQLARKTMGSGLRTVQHYGSYSCRAMTGNAGRASLHALARAIDVAAFVLADGRRISVKDHWGTASAAATFLRAVALAGCARFSAVLTPRTDRLHRDHLHFDLGAWRVCDA